MMTAATVEGVGQRAHLPRHVRADVDRRVELAAGQHRQVLVAVGTQVLGRGERGAVGLPPVQQRDGMIALQSGFRHRAADEPGATDEQDAHAGTVAAVTARTPFLTNGDKCLDTRYCCGC